MANINRTPINTQTISAAAFPGSLAEPSDGVPVVAGTVRLPFSGPSAAQLTPEGDLLSQIGER